MLTTRRIFQTWWPLAASWLLMGVEVPALSAVVARLPNPEINLAAYGGVVYPLALLIESPIIMLLAASTALCKDWQSYRKLYRFMMLSGAALTALHILIAFTPVYYIVVEKILGVPKAIVEPARIGLMIMTPWTWSIAYRRFHQGVLIRFGNSRAVGVGTVIRLSADCLVLAIGYLRGNIQGIVVATTAMACGVVCEAIYAGIVVRPILHGPLRNAPVVQPAVTLRSFLDFYIPLVLTSLLVLLANPIGSAALSRMPEALNSLAVWPVISGLIFLMRSVGIAYNEVVVALLDEPNSSQNLRRFAILLATVTTTILLFITATPISQFWFGKISGLPDHLTELASSGLWFALTMPAMAVFQSWFQGVMLHDQRTRGITEAVVIYLFTSAIILWAGVRMNSFVGLFVGLVALVGSNLTQTFWLWYRSRKARYSVQERDRLLASKESVTL